MASTMGAFLTDGRTRHFKKHIPLDVHYSGAHSTRVVPSSLSSFGLCKNVCHCLGLICLPRISVTSLGVRPMLSRGLGRTALGVGSFFCGPLSMEGTAIR